MALSNYTELQAAVRSELADVGVAGLSATALTDGIARAEAKINRKTRLREAERIATASYSANDNTIESRRIALPSGYVEMLDIRWKLASQDDTDYEDATYVAPDRIHEFYNVPTSGALYYTLRKQIEFNRQTQGVEYELMMHFIKRWDIATDATNWLLTNYPDAYLYGACAECALHLRDNEGVPWQAWKNEFRDALKELKDLSNRGRDDAEMDVSEAAGMSRRSYYNILNG